MTNDPTPAAAEARATKATETQATVSAWCEATFGNASSNARVAARANEEMAEMLKDLTRRDDDTHAIEEAADVLIILFRLAARMGRDLLGEVDRKMAVNRARKWNVGPDGHGYHVKETSLPPPEAKDGAAPEAPINLLAELKKAVAATEGAAPSPETGWRLAPRIATQAMKEAGANWTSYQPEDDEGAAPNADILCATRVYGAMLAAAPAAPSPDLAALAMQAALVLLTTDPDFGTTRMDGPGWWERADTVASQLRVALKAQPNTGPSADGGMGGQ